VTTSAGSWLRLKLQSEKLLDSLRSPLPHTRQKQIYVLDIFNLFHERWNTGHEDLLVMLDNDAEVDAMFTTRRESFSPQSTAVKR